MSDPAPLQAVPEAFARMQQPGKRRRRALKDGLPRRYVDARSRPARRYRELFSQITEAFPPRNRLGKTMAGMLADVLLDYESLRLNKKKGARSARRKTTGLSMGLLREVRNLSGHAGDDLAAELAKLTSAS